MAAAIPRQVLGELSGNAHSKAEIDAQKLYARSGLPPMVFNREIEDLDGNFVAYTDGWLDDVGLAWESTRFVNTSRCPTTKPQSDAGQNSASPGCTSCLGVFRNPRVFAYR